MTRLPVVESLTQRLGPTRVHDSASEPQQTERFRRDSWAIRTLLHYKGATADFPITVVQPQDTAEVADILKIAKWHELPVVPYGAGSGVCGGAVPVSGAVVIDLSAMNAILALSEHDLIVTAQPGVTGGDLEAWLNERGYRCGHYPQSIDVSSVGGWVATRSAGQFSTLYGNIEDLVVGLEVVTPDGEVLRFPANSPRRAAGPDLKQLFIGAEGSLGVITEVSLKVFPIAAARAQSAFHLPSMAAGFAALRRILQSGLRPAVVRLYDAEETKRSLSPIVREGPCLLLLFEGEEGPVQAGLEAARRFIADEGGSDLGDAAVAHWLETRNDVRAWDRFLNNGVIVDTMEVAGTWSRIGRIYDETMSALRAVPGMLQTTGHASHAYHTGINLYFTFGAYAKTAQESEVLYDQIWGVAMEKVLELGGTISHHHGIGKLRTKWLPRELGSAYPLLTAIKATLDPIGTLNPGTLLAAKGGEASWKPQD